METQNKVVFAGFGRNTMQDIRQSFRGKKTELLFEKDLETARDLVASDFPDILAVFVNISPKYIKGVSGVCGYISKTVSLIQDTLESSIPVIVSCPVKRHAVATLFRELDTKNGENFQVVWDIQTEYIPALVENLSKRQEVFI